MQIKWNQTLSDIKDLKLSYYRVETVIKGELLKYTHNIMTKM